LNILSGRDGIDCCWDAKKERTKQRKPVRGKLQNGERASGEVLLVAEVLVCRDEYVEDSFEAGEESTIDCAGKFFLVDGRYRVASARCL